MKKTINWAPLIIIVLLTELVGIVSSFLSGNSGQMYAAYIKPPFSPPGWVFGVVWPILYLLMGIACYLIYQSPPTDERRAATKLYWMQLAVNFMWPIVFFRFEMYRLSVLVILILTVLVILTTIRFYKINKPAGWLMVPYLLWLFFATYLNIGVAVLNM